MPKLFTLEEAELAIPLIEQRLNQAMAAKHKASQIDKQLEEISTKIHFSGGADINPGTVLEQRCQKEAAIQQLREAVDSVQQTGCLIKDLDTGLIDFPAALEDREVYLCWKLGEPRIDFWHSIDDGFAGRQPILDRFGPHAKECKPN